jgi:hypothetical protein
MRIVRIAVVAAALILAFGPLPAEVVESWYSQGLYLRIQNVLTPLSNLVGIAIFDVAVLGLVSFLVFAFVGIVRRFGLRAALVRGALALVTLSCGLYLVFLVLWGLNYRRVPLESKLEFDRSRITHAAVRALAEQAVRNVNAEYAGAQAPSGGPSLEESFIAAQRLLGASRLAVPGMPKRSALQWYFRAAAIDGMTDPYFLEVIINRDALPFERPFITLHEWAHLAGYAHEAEANFVAWVACTRGDALARYSGWMAIYEHAASSLPFGYRVIVSEKLDPGPRRDLARSANRYATSSPVVRTAARDVYDGYLRANRVETGIASYSAVTELIVGAGGEARMKSASVGSR